MVGPVGKLEMPEGARLPLGHVDELKARSDVKPRFCTLFSVNTKLKKKTDDEMLV